MVLNELAVSPRLLCFVFEEPCTGVLHDADYGMLSELHSGKQKGL